MHVASLTLSFYLSGCVSLKDKRRRLRGLKDRFGRLTNIAVCEAGHQDSLIRSEWRFVAAASSRRIVEQSLAQIEQHARSALDAELVGAEREWLC